MSEYIIGEAKEYWGDGEPVEEGEIASADQRELEHRLEKCGLGARVEVGVGGWESDGGVECWTVDWGWDGCQVWDEVARCSGDRW